MLGESHRRSRRDRVGRRRERRASACCRSAPCSPPRSGRGWCGRRPPAARRARPTRSIWASPRCRREVAPFAVLDDGSRDGARGARVIGTYLHGAFEDAAVCAEVFGVPVAPAGGEGRRARGPGAVVQRLRRAARGLAGVAARGLDAPAGAAASTGRRVVSFAVPSTIVVRVRAMPSRPFSSSASTASSSAEAAGPHLQQEVVVAGDVVALLDQVVAPNRVQEGRPRLLRRQRHRDERQHGEAGRVRVEHGRERRGWCRSRSACGPARRRPAPTGRAPGRGRPSSPGRPSAERRWLSNRSASSMIFIVIDCIDRSLLTIKKSADARRTLCRDAPPRSRPSSTPGMPAASRAPSGRTAPTSPSAPTTRSSAIPTRRSPSSRPASWRSRAPAASCTPRPAATTRR